MDRPRGWSRLDRDLPAGAVKSAMLSQAAPPYLLFDDARDGADAILYRRPVRTLSAFAPREVEAILRQSRAALDMGYHVAGYLAYEAGYCLEPKLAPLSSQGQAPLAWFGIFEGAERLVWPEVGDDARTSAVAGSLEPALDEAAYHRAMEAVLGFIAAGDVYQINLTFQNALALRGDPIGLYAKLRRAQRAGWGGVVRTGDRTVLCCSPELFFLIEDGAVIASPMKGTAARHADVCADAAAVDALRDSVKDRAENLMIVDLLRNDLSILSEPGTVAVPALFDIETYPTIHQMTSTITARLKPGVGCIELLRAIFPCGSITGAPKIRAMEIIHEIERQPRGIYTGSIGFVRPDGSGAFNVAIRTLDRLEGDEHVSLGLGSAIVADSLPDLEWAECLAKAAFIEAASARPGC